MALSLRAGTVTAVAEQGEELVRLEVDGVACVAYPRITGAVEEGDAVLVNVQARALGLGSGGFDVLYANLTRGLGLAPPEGAHVMALPYTPLQAAWTDGRGERTARHVAGRACRSSAAGCTASWLPWRPGSAPGGGWATSSSAAARCPCPSRTRCAT